MGATVKLFLPLHTTTPGNSRCHWRKAGAKAKTEREAAYYAVRSEIVRGEAPQPPVKITLTRCGPRYLDEVNLPGACKHLIDGIMDAFKQNDSILTLGKASEKWPIVFCQRKQSLYGVEILLESI